MAETTKREKALHAIIEKIIGPALKDLDSKTALGGWPDDTGLIIQRADDGEEDFTLGDLRRAALAIQP